MLAWFGFLSLVSGFYVARHLPEPSWWVLVSMLASSVIVFYWYHADSSDREFRRTVLMNIGVIGIAPLAIPVYVFQSSPRGQRLRSLGRMLGYFCLIILVSIVGMIAGTAIGAR